MEIHFLACDFYSATVNELIVDARDLSVESEGHVPLVMTGDTTFMHRKCCM